MRTRFIDFAGTFAGVLVRRSRQLFTTILELAGIAAIVHGVASFSVPAGWITGGISLVLIGFLEGGKA